jgi:L-threonylcarbamoyladenylate synthase
LTVPPGPRRLPDGPAARAEAVRALRDGAIVALPTDTVYGIAVALSTADGIERLFAAKARPPDRAVALLLAEPAQAEELGVLGSAARALAEAFWPGGLTLVVPRREDRPPPVALTCGEGPDLRTIGVRVPDHPAPRALAAGVGPLPTTSANRSGEPEARDAAEIAALLGGAVALILDGGPAHGGPPSTVVDVSGAEPRILRAGAIGVDDVSRVLKAAGLPEPEVGGVGR